MAATHVKVEETTHDPEVLRFVGTYMRSTCDARAQRFEAAVRQFLAADEEIAAAAPCVEKANNVASATDILRPKQEKKVTAQKKRQRAAENQTTTKKRPKQESRHNASFALERELFAHDENIRSIAGSDECGRGSSAGPLYAVSCSIVRGAALVPNVRDSKKYGSERMREEVADALLRAPGHAFRIVRRDVDFIDEVGVHRANMDALCESILQLSPLPQVVLVDGALVPDPLLKHTEFRTVAITGGDSRAYVIAAASVVCKVTRDRVMIEYDRQYPGYGFAQNKGYPGAAQHVAGLDRLGVCPIHRRSFAPIRKRLEMEASSTTVVKQSEAACVPTEPSAGLDTQQEWAFHQFIQPPPLEGASAPKRPFRGPRFRFPD